MYVGENSGDGIQRRARALLLWGMLNDDILKATAVPERLILHNHMVPTFH